MYLDTFLSFLGFFCWYTQLVFYSDIHMLHWSLITCYDFMQCSFLLCHHWKATRNVCYFLNNSLPISFYNFFVTRSPIHCYHTRSVDLLYNRFYRTLASFQLRTEVQSYGTAFLLQFAVRLHF